MQHLYTTRADTAETRTPAARRGTCAAQGRQCGKRLLYTGFFWLRMLPPISLTIPFYLIFSRAGLLDTRLGLTLALVPLNILQVVWILAGFLGGVRAS